MPWSDKDRVTEYMYSNSGSVLLSLVVRRVTGKSLDEFAQSRIFGPLGMKATRFQHDHSALVPGRATGYVRGPRRLAYFQQHAGRRRRRRALLVCDGHAALGENFDDLKLGAQALTTMQTPGRLGSGREIEYGMGLMPAEYQGLRIVEHSGSLGGYRTEFLRFPLQKLTVICLCNDGTANPTQLARAR